jgi:hypothetical protein
MTSDRTDLARMAKRVAPELVSGEPGPNADAVERALEARPEAAPDLLDLLIAEAGKKRPNERLVAAYGYMLGRALEYLRLAAEGGLPDAATVVDAVRQRLHAEAAEGRLEPTLLLTILREFAGAQLDPGPELRALFGQMAETAPPLESLGAGEDGDPTKLLDQHLAELAQALDGDPFGFCQQVREMTDVFPDDQRMAFGAFLLRSTAAVAREAALGWLLDPSAAVRNGFGSQLEQAAGSGIVSGTMLRRLIVLRNWLPEADRPAVDRAIQACRRSKVDVTPLPPVQVGEVLSSAYDGAGAQSLFVFTREGRRHAIGCFLLKQEIGIRDAWARHGMSRAELADFRQDTREVELMPVSLDYLRLAAAHGLATNLASGIMPPFGLLDAVETVGLQGLQPEALTTEAVLGLLEAEAGPALSQPEAAAELLASSARLPHEMGVLDSWFEPDGELAGRLGGKGMTRAKRIALVGNELLVRHAPKWVDRLARTALTLLHAKGDAPWEAFYVSARALASGRPIAEIPLMLHVAAQTVDAHEANRRLATWRWPTLPDR